MEVTTQQVVLKQPKPGFKYNPERETTEDVGPVVGEPTLELSEFLNEGEPYVVGTEMLKRAKAQGNLTGQSHAERLLDNRQDIPVEWRQYVGLCWHSSAQPGRRPLRCLSQLGRWSPEVVPALRLARPPLQRRLPAGAFRQVASGSGTCVPWDLFRQLADWIPGPPSFWQVHLDLLGRGVSSFFLLYNLLKYIW